MGGSRSVFTFKQFSLAHGNPGLKISTEACILGAWSNRFAHGKILDIGTGCGLMACMLAQSNPDVRIDAIEIHPEVAILALENIQNSPFKNQIQVINGDIRSISTEERYDFIICNPPFFTNHLPATLEDKQLAIHDDELNFVDLILAIKNLLKPGGKFAVIYPKEVMDKFEKELGKNGLFVHQFLSIFSNPRSKLLRVICLGSTNKEKIAIENLYIKDEKNEYTEAFKLLLNPYYLIFE
jgi:tRNA1Val (adenine37-N6)-methyltransferase